MLLAILEKRARIPMGGMDVFLNVTGGVKITDPAIDLSASLSIASSIKDLELPERCVAFGELGLSGEVRPVANTDRRIQEALRRNFKPIVVSRISLAKEWQENKNILAVDQLSEALDLLF
jgi:DNA repair protein RadA/Sms